MSYKNNISVVVGVGPTKNLELVKNFIGRFTADHPTVPLVLGALQCDLEIKEFLKDVDQTIPSVHVVFGDPADGHCVSFSENYNAAINAVKTEYLVLGHTDMVFCKNFFEVLERDMKPKNFYIYSTVEPPIYIGHRRPGKIIGDFGENFETFDQDRFEQHVSELQKQPLNLYRGYGFFLAGRKANFEDIGGFDMNTFSPVFCEDDDICVRIRQKGYYMLVDDHAIVYHFVSLTAREAKKSITAPEIEANRKFARKWGFEARFLWTLGYEEIDVPFMVFDRKIYIDTEDRNVAILTKSISREESDIDIEIGRKTSFESIANLVGSLRVVEKLMLGQYNFGECKVTVKNYILDQVRDYNNYLSLQRQIKYE